MKVLGGTRGQILAAQALEYVLIALVLAVLALAVGSAAAYYVIVGIFEFTWVPHWPTVMLTLGTGCLLTLAIGLLGSLPLMSVRPAMALRIS